MLNPLKNNKGAALATVIITMVVLMILGTAILNTAFFETKMSVEDENSVQAEYIAKSGADIAAKYISDNPTSATSSLTDNIGQGSYTASITWLSTSSVKIVSTGTVKGVTKTVTLLLGRKTYQDLFLGIRQTGTDSLDLSSMNVTYQPGCTVNIEANVDSLDQITLNATNSADPNIVKSINNNPPLHFTIPDSTGYNTALPISVSGTKTFIGNYRLTSLVKANGETLIFDTQGADQHIIVNTLSFSGSQGNVIVQGGGNVHLYIIDSGDIQTPIDVNSLSVGKLFLYVSDGKYLSISANGVVNAYIYAPNALVEIQSALTTVKGSIIGQIINRGNINGAKGTFYYIPLTDNPTDNPIEMDFKKIKYTD